MARRVSSCAELTFNDDSYEEIHSVIKKHAFKYMLNFRPDVLGLEVDFLADQMVLHRDLRDFDLTFEGAHECSTIMADPDNIREFIAEYTGSEDMADVYIDILSNSSVRAEKWSRLSSSTYSSNLESNSTRTKLIKSARLPTLNF